jgi:hypothetical protein
MKSIEKKLLKHFANLSPEQQQMLIQFAEFLVQKGDNGGEPEPIPEPVLLERPEEETVVGAIKRLTASYPMLERDKLFNETSMLMTKHVMHGHEAEQVIDELEALFASHYQALISGDQDDLKE